jgi:serine/threonine protein kinase
MKQCPLCLAEYTDENTTCPSDGARLAATREWAPGTVIGDKYRIVAKIGQGGMGTVYKAVHMALEEVCALKVMDSRLASDPKFLARFRQEARVARKLRHPNIVHVDDLDQADDGSLFIAMEFVDGVTLRNLLAATAGPLPLSRALWIARGVTEALRAAHALGLVHRDIKPDNILLARSTEGREIPKVLDFGIVALRESSANLSSRPLMTPAYAPPEQWAGMKSSEFDGRTDLYALGMTLYEMLTGSPPFHPYTNEGWMRAHLHETPLAPSVHNPALAGQPGVDRLVLKLLAKQREQRPANAEEVIADLNLIEAQHTWGKETVVVRPGAPPPPAPPQSRGVMDSPAPANFARVAIPRSAASRALSEVAPAPADTPPAAQPPPVYHVPLTPFDQEGAAAGAEISISQPPPRSAAPGIRPFAGSGAPAGVAVRKENPFAPARKKSTATQVGSIAGAVAGLVLGSYLGFDLLVPLAGAAGAFWLANKFLPPEFKPLLAGFSIQAGHLTWFLLGYMMAGRIDANTLDLILLGGGLAWLAMKPGIKPVVTLTVFQALAFMGNLNAFASASFGSPLSRALLTHLILRGAGVTLMWIGFQSFQRQNHASQPSPAQG